MADDPPDVPDELAELLERQDPATLRAVARYADRLADAERAPADETDGESGSEPGGDAADDPPADVPSKATLTVKEINDNRYYYWQWREGDAVKSKYARPVDADE